MTYSPATVANYFLSKASKDGRAVTPMQLLKLVYIAHGWHLGYFKEPLINEPVEAWKYGPVIRSLYQQVKKYGGGAVIGPLPTATLWGANTPITGESASLLDSVWDSYASYSGVQLSSMTHQPGTPWYKAYNDLGGKNCDNFPIPNADIRQHYEMKIQAMNAKESAAVA